MSKKQNLKTSNKKSVRFSVVSNRLYFYRTDVYSCVLCGKEKVSRKRVFDEKNKGTHWHEDACSGHF